MHNAEPVTAWAVRARIDWLADQLGHLARWRCERQCPAQQMALATCFAKIGDALHRAQGCNNGDAALRITLQRFAFDTRDHARAQPWAPMRPGTLNAMADSLHSLLRASRALDTAVSMVARPEGAA